MVDGAMKDMADRYAEREAPPSLRDMFAGHVIGGAVQAGWFALTGPGRIDAGSMARHAYDIADAMMAERKARYAGGT